MRSAHRIRDQLPSSYYEGFLEKRSLKTRTSRKLWAALCGDALFFYNNSKSCDYVEKQELSNFISLTDDPRVGGELDVPSLHLRLQDDDIYLTAQSLEARELWKGFILSVVKLQVPTSLNLLPGQVHMLREAVEKEKERLREITEKAAAEQASKAAATPDPNDYMSVLSEMPACFCKLSRIETENLLEKHKDKGNMVLRPNRDGTCFAVTTRQEFNGPVFQHYRVTRIPDGGFAIAVDNPIPCKTLHDVINCLIETTGGTYKPLVLEHTYEENIVYVDYDEENGEKSMRCASSSPVRPNLSPKPVYVDYDEVNEEKSMRCASSSPVRPNLSPKPAPKKYRDQRERIYQNSFEEDNNLIDEDEGAPLLPRDPERSLKPHLPNLPIGPGGALLPPNWRPPIAKAAVEAQPRRPISPVSNRETLSQCFNKELKQRLKEMKVTAD